MTMEKKQPFEDEFSILQTMIFQAVMLVFILDIYIYTHIYIHTYKYIYIYAYTPEIQHGT